MGLLGADDILKADTFRYDTMEVPEWGGTLRFRTISGLDRDNWMTIYARAQEENDPTLLIDAQARLIALSACDAEGKRIFKDEDIRKLNETQAADVLQRVFLRIRAFTEVEPAAELNAGKDSSDAQSDSTTSDSL